MTEAELEQLVLVSIRRRRLRVLDIADSRRLMIKVNGEMMPTGRGYLDLTIVGPGGILFRELKTQTGTLSDDQRGWYTDLMLAGADVEIWRPEHALDGSIENQLDRLVIR